MKEESGECGYGGEEFMIPLKRKLAVLLSISLIFCATPCAPTKDSLAAEENDFLSYREKEIVKELNQARKDPASYVRFFRDSLKYYHGKELKRPGEVILRTQEGKPAAEEAIRFLEKTKPVEPLKASRGMSLGARDLVQDQGKKGTVGHISSDKTQPGERVNRYGRWERTIGENIAYGPSGARDVVMSLIVDDGVPHRGHRKNIFNPAFHVVGVACGPHSVYRTLCVITFAGDYNDM
jgi:uncharacterized protein YkwD